MWGRNLLAGASLSKVRGREGRYAVAGWGDREGLIVYCRHQLGPMEEWAGYVAREGRMAGAL